MPPPPPRNYDDRGRGGGYDRDRAGFSGGHRDGGGWQNNQMPSQFGRGGGGAHNPDPGDISEDDIREKAMGNFQEL